MFIVQPQVLESAIHVPPSAMSATKNAINVAPDRFTGYAPKLAQ
jgi:hypothetical protein